MPSNFFIKLFSHLVCGPTFLNPLCQNFIFQIGGPESYQFNKTRLLVYMNHTPAGTSVNNIIHWLQMYISNKIQKFDYGNESENYKHYGKV